MTQQQTTSRGKVLWIFAVLGVVVLAMGIGAAWSFSRSQRYLEEVHGDFERQGEILSVTECVDKVLAWRDECDAMVSLCDSNVERMTEACLSAKPRTAYCRASREALSDSHFAAQACEDHDVARDDRKRWKRCGMAYRAVDLHCKVLAPGAE